MKVINLDKFKRTQKVIINGQMYEVYGVTVDMFLNEASSVEAATPKENVETMVKLLGTITNIPMEVLKSLTFDVLNALIQVSQGVDPDATLAEGDIEKNEHGAV
jgi:hypothetical protein